jgi:hypothetical protein
MVIQKQEGAGTIYFGFWDWPPGREIADVVTNRRMDPQNVSQNGRVRQMNCDRIARRKSLTERLIQP